MKTKTTKTEAPVTVAAAVAAAVASTLSAQSEGLALTEKGTAAALAALAAAAVANGAVTEAEYTKTHKEAVGKALEPLVGTVNAQGKALTKQAVANRAWCLGAVYVATSNGWELPATVRNNVQTAAAAARAWNVENGFAANPENEKGGRPAKAADTAAAESAGSVKKTEGATIVESPLPAAVQAVFPQNPDAQAALLFIIQNNGRKPLETVVMAMFEKMRPKN